MILSEKDNLPRFRRNQMPFYEVYSLKFHLLPEGLAFVLRYTLHVPKQGEPYACLWALILDRQNPSSNIGVRERFPLKTIRLENDIFYLQIADSALFQTGAHGNLKKDAFLLEWDLQLTSPESGVRLYPYSLFYYLPYPAQKYLTPQVSATYSGTLSYQGKTYTLKNVPGQQAHAWGTHLSSDWVWGHCNTFKEDAQAVFEGISFPAGWGALPMRTALFYLRWFGKEYFFNSPLDWWQNQSHYEDGGWRVEMNQGRDRFVVHFTSSPQNFLTMPLEDPDFSRRLNAHSAWASCQLEHYRLYKRKWELQATLHSKSATLEHLKTPGLGGINKKS